MDQDELSTEEPSGEEETEEESDIEFRVPGESSSDEADELSESEGPEIPSCSIPAVPAPTKVANLLKSNSKKKKKRGNKVVLLGAVHKITFEITSDATWIKPNTSHKTEKDGYHHSNYIKSINTPEGRKKDAEKAHIRAIALQECVMIDNDDVSWMGNAPQGARRRMVRAMQPDIHTAAIADMENIARKWIVDSGCPLDLISTDELSVKCIWGVEFIFMQMHLRMLSLRLCYLAIGILLNSLLKRR